MSLLALRRWPRSRLALPAAAPAWRAQRPAFARSLTFRHNQPKDAAARIIGLNSGILIPSSIKDTQPASLIQHIQPIPLQQLSQNTFCVFLVTPSFAQWLGNDDVFVQKALSAVYSTWLKELGKGVVPSALEVDVLCAVVDKLPTGRALNPNNTLEDEVFTRSTQPPVSESGFEGIAYVTLPSAASVSSAAPVSPDKGAIDFIIPEHTGTPDEPRDILRLPLANTVFQTGTPRTMTLSKWKLWQSEQTEETKQPMELISKTDISHHGIRITSHDQTMSSVTSALSLPLIPLTHGRQVNGCMGNIIRQVVGPEKAIVTASSELEEVVPRFFKSRGEPVQATTVWALVVPRQLQVRLSGRTLKMLKKYVKKNEKGQDDENKLWECLWRRDPPHWYHLASKALLQGARLHRVLSGGGGWGKKAGLLALDPVPMSDHNSRNPAIVSEETEDFEARIDRHFSEAGSPSLYSIPLSESSSRNSAIASEDPEDLASALAPVVQEGDYIQFFISPVPASASGVDPSIERQKLAARPQDKTCGWEIGTIPSTADSMPGGSWQHAPSAANHISVFQNSFGALAEGGLTFTRRFQLRNQGKAKQVLFEGVGTTTVDVPFSRFWAIEVAEKGFARKNKTLTLREQKSLKKARTNPVVKTKPSTAEIMQNMSTVRENALDRSVTYRIISRRGKHRPLIRAHPSMQAETFAKPSTDLPSKPKPNPKLKPTGNPPPTLDRTIRKVTPNPDRRQNPSTEAAITKRPTDDDPLIRRHPSFKFSTPLNNRQPRSLYRSNDPLWRVLQERQASARRVVALWRRQGEEKKRRERGEMGKGREELDREVGAWVGGGGRGDV